jgi:hypothetical protein
MASEETMSTTEVTTPSRYSAEEPGGMSAGADIYRRLERRPRRPKWMAAIPIAVLALAAAGGVIAYEAMSRAPTPSQPPTVAATQPAPAAPAAAPVNPPAAAPQHLAVVPVAPAPAPVAHRSEHARADVTRRTTPAARAAPASGEDANAYRPPTTISAPPAPQVVNPAPPSSFSVPLPPANTAAPQPQAAQPAP